MTSNRLTVDALAGAGNVADLSETPVEHLALVAADIADLESKTKLAKQKLNQLVGIKFAPHLAGHTMGTKRIHVGDLDVVVTISKRVDWNNEALSQIETKTDKYGKPLWSYFKIERSISEAVYANLDDDLVDLVNGARTVKPGSQSVKFEQKGA